MVEDIDRTSGQGRIRVMKRDAWGSMDVWKAPFGNKKTRLIQKLTTELAPLAGGPAPVDPGKFEGEMALANTLALIRY